MAAVLDGADREIEIYLPNINKKIHLSLDIPGYMEDGEIYKFKFPMTKDDLYKHPHDQQVDVFQEHICGIEDIHTDILEELKSLEK